MLFRSKRGKRPSWHDVIMHGEGRNSRWVRHLAYLLCRCKPAGGVCSQVAGADEVCVEAGTWSCMKMKAGTRPDVMLAVRGKTVVGLLLQASELGLELEGHAGAKLLLACRKEDSIGPVWLCNWVAVMDLQTWVRIGLLNGP